MSFQREVYTLTHVLFMTSAIALTVTGMYAARHKHPDLVWFIENWGLYIGIVATVGTFLFGLSLVGKPFYDEETNKQLESEHNRAVFEWNSKSREERAILMAAEENRLLHLTQIIQNNQIIGNQEQAKPKRRY